MKRRVLLAILSVAFIMVQSPVFADDSVSCADCHDEVAAKMANQIHMRIQAFEVYGHTVGCEGCHGDVWRKVACNGDEGLQWKLHLAEGRVAESVWEKVSVDRTGTTCGW